MQEHGSNIQQHAATFGSNIQHKSEFVIFDTEIMLDSHNPITQINIQWFQDRINTRNIQNDTEVVLNVPDVADVAAMFLNVAGSNIEEHGSNIQEHGSNISNIRNIQHH